MIPPPRNILVSYHYYRKYDLDKLAGLRIIGDSGAYSARMQNLEITNDELAAWITRWRHRLCWAACMDVAGDTLRTRRNWQVLVDKGIPAVSSIHVGTPPSEMDWYADRGVDFLGLGGLAGGTSSPSTQIRWLVSVFRYARDNHPGMRFHGWGLMDKRALQLPFYSVDSSGWSSGYRYGRMTLRDPRTGKAHNITMNGRDTYAPEVATMLRDCYGVNPSELATSGPHNRHLMVKLSALSASVYEQQFQRRHRNSNITRPVWGQFTPSLPAAHLAAAPHEASPLIHLAEGSSEHLEVVRRMSCAD